MKKILSILLMLMCISLGANAARCKATTAKGSQCSRNAVTAGYCTQHFKIQKKKQNDPGYERKARQVSYENGRPKKATSNSNRCVATTKKGTRCKPMSIPGTKYCGTHTK